jgi:hypothetical protein
MTTETRFVGVPAPILKAALADLSGWRVLGARMLARSRDACPVGKQQDAADMSNYNKPHGGSHLRDSMIAEYVFGLDPRILIGSKMTRGPDNVSALGLILQGTDAHTITPANAKALRFSSGGQVVFAASVQHPGTKENPFVQRSIREVVLESVALL